MSDEQESINIKKVDEAWKAQVEKERSAPAGSSPKGAQPAARGKDKESMPADFGFFLSSLSMQAMIALGELPHPATNERQEDLEQARYLIDVLGMLQAKTKGNLTPEEESMLEGLLYELRMKYVARMKR